MATTVSLAGTSYSIPAEGDGNYASDLTAFFIALANNTKVFQVSSANFPLQQETNFGTNYGLKVAYIKSQATNPSGTGIVRLGNNESLSWRNAGNTSDLALKVNASDALEFNGTSISIGGSPVQTEITVSDTSTVDLTLSSNNISADIIAGSLSNSHISASAAIAYSKLALTGSIVNADVSASAAISYSKLSLSNSILNSDISASAAIALSKLAVVTASRALVSDASGIVSASAVTATELGYLSGVSSAIQTQLDAKQAAATAVTLTGTQTLTNKTLTSPVINSPTGIVKADVGLSNVDNTSDSTKNGAVAVLTNKDIDGGTASNTSRITLPKNTKANLDALTRKEGTLVYASDQDKVFVDDGTNLKEIGSGSGAINLVENGDGSIGTDGFTEGYYAAADKPAGSFTATPNGLTISSTGTSPLGIGSTSLVFTKAAGDKQGAAVTYDISVPLGMRANVLSLDVNYILNSGTFQAGSSTQNSDLIFYFYDVTNSTFLEPTTFNLYTSSTTIPDTLRTYVQVPYNCEDLRLIAYVSTFNTSAWEVKADISVSNTEYAYGTVQTDWQTGTISSQPSGLGSGSGTYNSVRYKQLGDTALI